MTDTIYLTEQDVIDMHDVLVQLHGNPAGVRDMGGLSSAVARPQIGYYNNIIEEAAALMQSLVQNHPFIDGNKRTAFAATDSFLTLNGYDVANDENTRKAITEKMIRMIEQKQVEHENFVELLNGIASAV